VISIEWCRNESQSSEDEHQKRNSIDEKYV